MIDDLRAEVGPYRNDTVHFTPTIDAFAKEAVTFKHAYANVALCGPSRASLFTGRTPRSLNYFQHNLADIIDNRVIEKSPIQSLPKLFQSLGYSTVGAGKVFHRDANLDEFQQSLDSRSVPCECDEVCPKMTCTAESDDLTDTPVVDFCLDKLEEFSETGENFFMSIGIRKPHLPYRVPQRSLDKIYKLYGQNLENMPVPEPKTRLDETSPANYYCDAIDQFFSAIVAAESSTNLRKTKVTPKLIYPDFLDENDYFTPSNASLMAKNLVSVSTQLGSAPASDALLKQLKLGYFAAVNWADELLGRVVNKLTELELDDNTIVVVFADNGFNLGEQGNYCKNNNFEMGTKVPLFVKHPNKLSIESNKMVTLLDLYPSILDLAFEGSVLNSHPLLTQARQELHGHSFASEMSVETQVEESDESMAFSGVFRCWDEDNQILLSCERSSDVNVMGYSVRTKEFRYTEWRVFNDYSFNTRVIQRELYDHSNDLDQFPDQMEIVNLIDQLSDNSKQLSTHTIEELQVIVNYLSNHLEAHFSCDDLDCVDITESFSPTINPTIIPTINPTTFPTQKPSKSPTLLPTFENSSRTSSPSTIGEPELVGLTPALDTAISAAISLVIMLACIAIAAVVIVYTKTKQAELAKRTVLTKQNNSSFKKTNNKQ